MASEFVAKLRSSDCEPRLEALFEEVAARYADNTAVHEGKRDWRYTDLNQLANGIAAALHEVTAEREIRVALFLQQGAVAIAAMLGTLKSGATFVPLDVSDPAPRVQQILQDCQPHVILTTSHYAAFLPEVQTPLHGNLLKTPQTKICPIIDIDTIEARETVPARHNPPSSLACIMYTSGSTGVPKGVCQTHSNILRYVRSYSSTLKITANDRLSLLYSLSFSAGNLDIYAALLHGATLFPYHAKSAELVNLASWIGSSKISVLHMVPSLFRYLALNAANSHHLSSVRVVDLGGEFIYRKDVDLFRQRFSATTKLYNHYAATEISVICQLNMDDCTADDDRPLPAGHASEAVKLYVLNEEGEPLPQGATGAVHLQSDHLSPGYWNRSDLDNAQYPTYPAVTEQRLYNTGDEGMIDDQGLLWVLGRKNSRIKVRGHSVYIAEVEAGINRIDVAADIAVLELPKGSGNLVACLGGVEEQAQTQNSIRDLMRTHLPDYMVPGEIVLLEKLPKTASGKIDRLAIEKAHHQRQEKNSVSSPSPRTAVEEKISALFLQLLPGKEIHFEDSFFALGGDSLLFAHLHTAIEDTLGVYLAIDAVLDDPSISGLARKVEEAISHPKDKPTLQRLVVPVRATGKGTPFFLVHGAQGMAHISPAFVELLGEDRPFFAFQAQGLDGQQPPHRSIEEFASAYIHHMRQLQPHGPYMIGGLCAGGIIAYEMARQLRAMGEAPLPLLLIDPPLERMYSKGSERLKALRARLKFFAKRLSFYLNPLDRRARKIADRMRAADKTALKLPESLSHHTITAAAQVQFHFQLALGRYQMPSYSGDIYLIASKQRLANLDPNALTSGSLQVFPAATVHDDVIDARNPKFVRAVQAYATDTQAVSAQRQGT